MGKEAFGEIIAEFPAESDSLKSETKRVAQEGAQNSVKKRVHFGTHKSRVSVHASHKALTAREVRVFKAAWRG